jgi:PTH1 family peptidyl-tRNA hydrolase
MRIIVGLGNPGQKYEKTRHNFGFMAVDILARRKNLSWKDNKKFKALIAEDSDYILVKPLTFMNDSGKAVVGVMRYSKRLPFAGILPLRKNIDLSDSLVVIHDELDLPFNTFKLSTNSGSAGHNGVQSIIDSLKTKNFKRLRLGVASPAKEKIPGDKFVLQRFTPEEESQLNALIDRALAEL